MLLLEAGGDPRTSVGDNPNTPHVNSLPDDYDVPAFHALSSENSGMTWEFWGTALHRFRTQGALTRALLCWSITGEAG